MGWITSKTMKPRKNIQVEVFGMPHLQLGDIVTIDYEMPTGDKFLDETKQFVVTEMQYARNENGPSQVIRVVEV
jgi:ribosomal protein S17